jgi:hypothetical protein
LNETALKGATAYTATATDADGDDITYSLSGTDAAKFAISSAGVVTLNAALDYETKATYEFTVTATDPEDLYDSVDVTGAVVDRDENPFTTTSSSLSASDLSSKDYISGEPGDTLVTITADFDKIGSNYADYEAIEIAQMKFTGILENALIKQTGPLTGAEADFNSTIGTVASPYGDYDVGVTGVKMLSASKPTKDLFYFVVDKDVLSESFEVTAPGSYQLWDEQTDLTTDVLLDPFIFTVDIA